MTTSVSPLLAVMSGPGYVPLAVTIPIDFIKHMFSLKKARLTSAEPIRSAISINNIERNRYRVREGWKSEKSSQNGRGKEFHPILLW